MKSKYISEILNEYETVRDNNLKERGARLLDVYSKHPRVREIDEEINLIGLSIISSVFKGIDIEKYISVQKSKIEKLKEEKSLILSKNNYPKDYLEIKYNCNKCEDTGYVGTERCSCFKQKLIDRYYRQSNLKNILNEENFDNFNFKLYSDKPYEGQNISPRKNIQSIYRDAVNFVKNFANTDENLFFYGNSGLGKTFLANCIAKDVLDSGFVVIYQTAANLIGKIGSLKFSDNLSKEQIDEALNEIVNCDLLIIDDLGTEPVNSYSYSELFNVINSRILNNKKTIISTNFDMEDLIERYPERIKSRIFGHYTMHKFFGEDIRIKSNIKKRKAQL